MQTANELRHLAGENRERGWDAIPSACPEHLVGRIIEKRAKLLGIPVQVAPRPTETDVELEHWRLTTVDKLKQIFDVEPLTTLEKFQKLF
jgi:hypothetical protein